MCVELSRIDPLLHNIFLLWQNPTLQALYPLSSTLNIIRTLQPAFSPIPNTTSFGDANTVYAQLFYDGVEQFYCHADTCTQDLGTDNGGANWQCSNLQCTCRPSATFCGGVPSFNLTGPINSLGGTLSIECGAVDPSQNSATCNFKQDILQGLFGSGGLTLNGCTFGECVLQNVIDDSNGISTPSATQTAKSLSGGVIAGLAVIGGLLLLSLIFLAIGLKTQRTARKSGHTLESRRTSVGWSELSYIIPSKTGAFRMNRRNISGVNSDKVILDNVNGKVVPGQMMAILGPSGQCKCCVSAAVN